MTRATEAVPVAAAGLLLASGLAVLALALAVDRALLDLTEMDIVFQEQSARGATWYDECDGWACARGTARMGMMLW